MDNYVKITEVGPRDGLQNEKILLTASEKFQYIQLLVKAGCKHIESGAFVNPKAIPQMSNTQDVFERIFQSKIANSANFSVLVPNVKGMNMAIASHIQDIAVFTANSETFNKKNINSNIEESLIKIKNITKIAQAHKIRIRAYISTVFGCPYEGKTSLKKTINIIKRLLDMGANEIVLGDTIGTCTPQKVEENISLISKIMPLTNLTMHFHDTYEMALQNIETSLKQGIRSFDSSTAGIGGCPYANGSTGNLATENLVKLLNQKNFTHDIQQTKLLKVIQFLKEKKISNY